jgi:prepilin-type N-terminal cleavage/methylation domain-containing protein
MPSTNKRRSKIGFTLIELLIVIAIIGILAGMVVVNMSGATDAAKIAKSKSFSNSVRTSLLSSAVSEWTLDEGGGTSVLDTWGGNAGTLVNSPTWRSGADCIFGSCLDFNGSYVRVPYSTNLNITGPITMEAWIYPRAFTGWAGIISVGGWLAVAPSYSSYAMQIWTDGSLRACFNWNQSPTIVLNSSSKLTLNKWHHVVVTYDGAQIREYIDGVSAVAPTTWAGPIVAPDPSHYLYLGSDPAGSMEYFNGRIDNPRVYNAALPSFAVRENYLAGLDKLLAGGQITKKDYQQKIADLNSNYATSE